MDRTDPRLLPQRRDEAECSITMLDALADGIDTGVVGLQCVIDKNAALAAQTGSCRKLCVGPHTCRHDYEIRGDFRPVVEAQAANALFAQDGGGLCRHAEL